MTLTGSGDVRRHGYRGKRWIDLILAIVALTCLWPAMAVVAVIIVLRMGRPVFFTQMRLGLHAAPFLAYKFRTMLQAYDPDGRPLSDGDRLTRLGRFLRVWSLDELPGLFNVLRGQMSLVGPRPLLPLYLPHYTDREMLRFEVPPGITGWAQIHGRNDLPWDQRLACDVWYAEHCSVRLDLRILWCTAFKVLWRSNVQVDSTEIEGDLSLMRAASIADT